MWNIQFQIVMHPTFFLNTYKYRSIPLIFPQPDQWLSDCTANIWWHQFDECAHKLKSRWCCEAVTLFSSYVNMPHVPLSAELFAFVWSKLIFGGVVNYCASKHGIENATYSLLLALFGKRGRHTVNCIVFFFLEGRWLLYHHLQVDLQWKYDKSIGLFTFQHRFVRHMIWCFQSFIPHRTINRFASFREKRLISRAQ